MSELLDGTTVPVIPAAPAPVAAENATDPAVEVEKVETPEDKHAKAIAKMERRIATLTARTAQERAEKDLLRRELDQAKAKPSEPATPEELTEDEIDRRAGQKAAHSIEIGRITEKANKVANEGKKEFPDFMERVGELHAALGPQFGRDGRPTPLMDAILDSDAPAKVLHHLASDLDLAAEIAALSPHRMTRRLVQLESELAEKPKPSAAPTPLKPVKSSTTPADPDPSDTKKWIEARNKALRSK